MFPLFLITYLFVRISGEFPVCPDESLSKVISQLGERRLSTPRPFPWIKESWKKEDRIHNIDYLMARFAPVNQASNLIYAIG